MKREFLTRLYWLCVEPADNSFTEGLNLGGLYERIDDTEQADKAFEEAVESVGLDAGQQSELERVCCGVSDAHELQGFINGFRLCARLGQELIGSEKEAVKRE